jgi:membrane protease YdiL (CAAX protease family)
MEKKKLSSGSAAWLVMLWAASLFVMQMVSRWVSPLFSEGWMQYVWTGIVELAFILIPLFVVCRIQGIRTFACIGSPRGEGRAMMITAIIALFGYPVMLLMQNLWIFLLETLGAVPEPVVLPEMKGIPELVIAVVSVAGCAAFTEEIAMRGVLMPGLRGRMGNICAMLITAFIFSIMHGSFSSLPYTFLFGWLLCWLTLRSRSILPAMTFHFVNNAIATVISYFAQGAVMEQAAVEITPEIRLMSIVSMSFVVLPALAMLAVLLYFYRRVTPGTLPA